MLKEGTVDGLGLSIDHLNYFRRYLVSLCIINGYDLFFLACCQFTNLEYQRFNHGVVKQNTGRLRCNIDNRFIYIVWEEIMTKNVRLHLLVGV